MNWTASLLRNQLSKERKAHQEQLNLLISINKEAKEYLELEKKLDQTKASLAESENNLTYLLNQTKSKDQAHQAQLLEKESEISHLEQKIKASKELVFNLKKEIRENSLYYQRSLKTSTQNLKEQLANTKKELVHSQKELAEWQGEGADNLRELKARAKLLTKLEQQTKEQKNQLDLLKSKNKQLKAIFKQIISYLNNTLIIRKAPLREHFQHILEIMQWEGMGSLAGTSSNTPIPSSVE